MSVQDFEGAFGKLTAEDSEYGRFATLAVLECRGLEPVDFEPRIGLSARGAESTTIFDDIDLTSGDWADFDERAGEAVCICDVETRVEGFRS